MDNKDNNNATAIKAETEALRAQLTVANAEKEKLFDERNAIGKQIVDLITQVKAQRDERNQLTKEARSAKELREKLNTEIKQKVEVIKNAPPEKQLATPQKEHGRYQQHGHYQRASRLKEEIDRIDLRIETEGVSFEEEKRLMKRLKELKKQYTETAKAENARKESREISKEINALKKEANAQHHAVQVQAKMSQEKHEYMVALSKKIEELKSKEKELNNKIQEKKKHVAELFNRLKEKTGELVPIKERIREQKREQVHQRHVAERKKLSERVAEIEEKLRKGEKLTTEDIMVIQASDSS